MSSLLILVRCSAYAIFFATGAFVWLPGQDDALAWVWSIGLSLFSLMAAYGAIARITSAESVALLALAWFTAAHAITTFVTFGLDARSVRLSASPAMLFVLAYYLESSDG